MRPSTLRLLRWSVCGYHGRLLMKKCHLSTVTPLVSAFNSKKSKPFSFLNRQKNVGLFRIPELTDVTGFKVLEDQCMENVSQLVKEVFDPHRTRKLVVILDEMSDGICRVADMCEFVRLAHPRQDMRQAAEQTYMRFIELVEKLNTNVGIYQALQDVMDNGDVVELTETDRRVTNLLLQDFKQCGIHLDDERREKYVQTNNLVTRLCDNFSHMTHEPTPKMDFQIPKDVVNIFHFENNRSYISSLQNTSENPAEIIREGTYRIFLYPNKQQELLLQGMLEGRRLMANLTGFESFTQRTLQGTITETPEQTMQFLEHMAENVREGAAREYDSMYQQKLQLKQQDENTFRHPEIKPWDVPFFTSVAKQELCKGDEIMEYFSLGNCMEGLNSLFQSLYGITLENVVPDKGEGWDNGVYKLAVTDEKEGVLGYIYCDLFERNNKAHQDCLFTIQGGKLKECGEYQKPIVVLHLNLRNVFVMTPPLLSPHNLDNLFHEFGHAMHSMIGRTHYQHVTGTRCPIDMAEVPSVLMEYFASDPRVVKTFAKHFKDGHPMPEAMLRNYCKSKRLYLYSDIQQQIFYAILDQIYHGKDFEPLKPIDILQQTQNKYYGLPYVENTAWHLRFSHLAGYGGRYYSYLVSRAIASKIWRQMFKADPFSRESGELYRNKLLCFGGEKHPSDLIEDLLGEKPTIDMLVESLTEDLRTRSVIP